MDSSSTFECIPTTLGLAKIAAAVSNGSTVNISQIAIGDGGGNPVQIDPNQIELTREVYRAGINSLTRDPVNQNYIVAELLIPPEIGGWTVREFGIFDNAGSMIAVGQYPDSYKPLPTQGAARDMIIRAIIQITSDATVNLLIDGNLVVASRQWVTDNFGADNLFPGGNTGEVLRKKSNADGDVEWHDPAAALNVTVDVIEEDQTLASGQVAIILGTVTTDSLAVYIDGVRLRKDQFTITGETTLTLLEAPTAGQKLIAVQNEPAGADEFLRTFRNLSDVPDKAAARVNLGIATQAEILTAVYQTLYPVGEIYVTRRTGNPGPIGNNPGLLGFGTWERYSAGRALFGLDPADASFNAVDLEGGAKAVALTSDNLPSHTHSIPALGVTVDAVGDHAHSVNQTQTHSTGGQFTQTGSGNNGIGFTPTSTGAAGGHAHNARTAATNTGAIGSGTGHNNLPPYKVVNVWKRTA